MGKIALPIAEGLKLSDFIINIVTGDLDEATARRQSRDTEGASIAWVIGHLIHYRNEMYRLLGHEPDDSYAKQFGSAGASDGSDYPPFAELVNGWNDASAKLVPAMQAAADDVLTRQLSGDGGPHGAKRVLDLIVFFMWHESYHIGQIGTLRAQFGLTATATLAEQASAT